jgi:cytochrome P450
METLARFRGDRLGFLQEMASFGDVSHVAVRDRHFYLLNHPELIQDVLVTHDQAFVKSRALQVARRLLGNGLLTSEGDFHLRQRRLVQPAFHRQRVAAYGEAMATYAAQASDRWAARGIGFSVDMSQEMMRLTLAIVGKTLFDADVEGEAREIGQALTEALHALSRTLLPGGEVLEKLPLPANQRAEEASDRLDATIYRIIRQRRASGEDRGDLLSTLLAARDEDGSDTGGMTDLQVRDEAMTLFLAGHETTANALAWTWTLLAQNPVEERLLHAELDSVLAGRPPTVDDLPNLPYTRMILSESMRLYPPAYVIGRQTLEDYPVRGYVVPAGATVFVSQYVMHRDPRYWFDAGRFDPKRWTADAQARRAKFTYFPFGAGPRVCIGESFAWTEGLLVLATLAQRWQARLVLGHPITPEPLITLRPKFGLRMTLHRRRTADG